MIVKKCIGCGELLQTEAKNKSGFTPKLTVETNYCQRCFRMRHYNELPKVLATNEDYLKVVDYVLQMNGLMLFIVDIFAFGNTFRKEIIDKLRGKDVIVVVNKFDLLPKSINVSDIVNFVAKECEKVFFKVIGVTVVSAKKGHYIDELMTIVDDYRRGRDVYVLGSANVGKSSFINAILKRCTSREDDLIATSIIPGTTLKEIVIPFFDDNKAIIDTPGLINKYDILEHINPQEYNLIVPKNEIKAKTYQLFGSYTYFIGGLAYLKFVDAKNISVVFYLNDNLKITRVKNEKLDDFITNKVGNFVLPPSKEDNLNLNYLKEVVKINGKQNIFFAGFGFVTIIGKTSVEVGYLDCTEVKIYGDILSKSNH